MTLPDICARKHRGSATSEAANRRIHPHKPLQRESVLAFIAFMGSYGATCKEVTQILKIGYTSASPRITELKEEGLIACNGSERDGAWVYVATGKNNSEGAEPRRAAECNRNVPGRDCVRSVPDSAEMPTAPNPTQTSLFAERPQ